MLAPTLCAVAWIAAAAPLPAESAEDPPTEVASPPAKGTVWIRQLVGASGWPSGAVSDTRVQYRLPGPRSKSILFQDTYWGFGGRLQVSPSFIDIGPRISIAPIDLFDIDLQASWTGYAGPYSSLPFYDVAHRTEPERNARRSENFPMYRWTLSATPTLKAKVGPVIVFDTAQFAWVYAKQPKDVTAPYWYENWWDMVLAWQDVVIENTAAVLFDMGGEGREMTLLGGVMVRHRQALVSHEKYTNFGPNIILQPGDKPAIPAIIGQVLFYVDDVERTDTTPNMILAVAWVIEKPRR